MNRAPCADGHLAYDDLGDGPPVVLLHDGTLDRRVWRRQLAAFDGYRLLNLDARSHGESSTPTTEYRRGDDVTALLDHLGLDSAFLVGQSMGGTSALDVALDHPERVDGLVISGCGTSEQHWRGEFVVGLLERQARCVAERDTEGYVERFLDLWVDGPHRDPHEVDPAIRADCRAMAMHTATRHARPDPVLPGKAADTWDRLPEVSAPLLGILGELDVVDVREMLERITATVPGAELDVVAGAGHMVNMERPDRFNASVRRFLDALTGRT
ncbi:alpha/beta fold hydrolase [Saccharopolyspora sp. CA-218241]|uniref:alpha/beta fold hydrolase n=1 Tax=Saccharopolyspora sp. CA-218241 TaxID=3240027 RepID=UPI003D98ABD0